MISVGGLFYTGVALSINVVLLLANQSFVSFARLGHLYMVEELINRSVGSKYDRIVVVDVVLIVVKKTGSVPFDFVTPPLVVQLSGFTATFNDDNLPLSYFAIRPHPEAVLVVFFLNVLPDPYSWPSYPLTISSLPSKRLTRVFRVYKRLHIKLPLIDHLNYDQVIVDPLSASTVI